MHRDASSPATSFSRREWLHCTSLAAAAGTLPMVSAGSEPAHSLRKLLVIWLHGGVSQRDTWDCSTHSSDRQFAPIATSSAGVSLSELFPRLARQMHHVTVVRGLPARSAHHASALADRQRAVDALCVRAGLPAQGKPQGGQMPGVGREWHRERDFLKFDWPRCRDLYGESDFGRAAAWSVRSLAAGACRLEIQQGGWDTHTHNAATLRALAARVDPALAALLQDLGDLGLLAETGILVLTEFGRTPEINPQGGRDHWSEGGNMLASRNLIGSNAPALLGATEVRGACVRDLPTVPATSLLAGLLPVAAGKNLV